MKIYIDHNVLDALSKNQFSLNAPDNTVWIYSHETFNEIKRSGDLRFLNVLRELKAQKIELVLDKAFKITGEAFIHDYRDPKEFYEQWLEAIGQHPVDENMHLQFLSRLAGGNNHEAILDHPDRLRNQIRNILEPYGLYNDEVKAKVDSVANDIGHVVSGSMQEIGELENTRQGLGTSRGRAGNTAEDDTPLESLWLLIQDKYENMTPEQFYGFDPVDKQGYEKWPLYLGIVGCHTMLNFLGFNADRGLANAQKLPGILSDGAHTAMAIYCDAIISKDKKFCAKARAIYRYLGLNIQVLEIELKNG
ncbi:hypothetical protein J7X56_004539 [Vibrio parahaemolyticus]|nr:hypothetical protein [Vibrio parahaemolyticus]